MMDYKRITAFTGIGKDQKKLSKKIVAILGVGTIGSNAAIMLAKIGVGRLIIADRDIVEKENLPVTPYLERDIGKPKVFALKQILQMTNPDIKVTEIPEDIDHNNIQNLKADVIIDCTDNLESRFLLNEYCMKNKLPLVHCASLASLVTIFVVHSSACLSCIYQDKATKQTCETSGIIPSAASIAANLAANEAAKIMLGKPHEETLLRMDVWKNTFTKIKIERQKKCPVHAGIYEYLGGKGTRAIKLCGSNMFQIKGKKVDLVHFKKITKGVDFGYCVSTETITVFEDGRALIKASTEAEAKSIYSKIVGN